MKKDIFDQACENNAEMEKTIDRTNFPAQDAADPKQEWWLSVKYPDSPYESDR